MNASPTTITPVSKLVIDRQIWYRGESEYSRLLLNRDDLEALRMPPNTRKQCCVGIYLTACGVADAHISGTGGFSGINIDVPTELDWLLDAPYPEDDRKKQTISDIYRAYDVNDKTHISDAERERRITEIFARHGVDVTFIN